MDSGILSVWRQKLQPEWFQKMLVHLGYSSLSDSFFFNFLNLTFFFYRVLLSHSRAANFNQHEDVRDLYSSWNLHVGV